MKATRWLSVILVICMLVGSFGITDVVLADVDADIEKETPDVVVVLDPGHDSVHGGATSFGYKEHEIVFKIATYCKQELEEYAGVKVYMTRPSNNCAWSGKVSTKECNEKRIAYAEEVGADVYISFHLDAVERGSAKGASVYYPNSNYRPQIGAEGKELASLILEELMNIGISKNGEGIKVRNSEDNTRYPDGSLADYLAVIRNAKKADIPAVLIEHLFITNRDDVNKFISTEAKIKEIGVADATAIAKHLGLSEEVHVREAEDGNWYYYDGDEVDTTYTGLARSEEDWLYVKEGQVDFTMNGLVAYKKDMWYVKDGKVDLTFDGVETNEDGTWYIENGKVDYEKDGVLSRGGNWYYFKGGQVQRVNTVAQNANGWWYIKNGQVDFTANTVAQNSNGWWYIKDGQVDFTYNGLGTNANGTWYIHNGQVDFGVNGLHPCGDAMAYFVNGAVDTSFNGEVVLDDVVYVVENGYVVVDDESEVEEDDTDAEDDNIPVESNVEVEVDTTETEVDTTETEGITLPYVPME